MTQDIENRVVAFVRTIANRCKFCLRRREENCSRCDSRQAVRLLRDIELDIYVTQKDYSLFARMQKISEILKKSATPLLSSQIDLDGLCSNQLKQWTLKRMLRIGVICRRQRSLTANGYRTYCYYLKPNKKETKK